MENTTTTSSWNNNISSGGGGLNSHCTSFAWDVYDWTNHNNSSFNHQLTTASSATTTKATTTATLPQASVMHALMYPPSPPAAATLFAAGVNGSHYNPDPHLMCLKLGKRHYFEDPCDRHVATAASSASKRGRQYATHRTAGGGRAAAEVTVAPAPTPSVTKCQVDGCHVTLVKAKEYHRRHRVCEMHSKAPSVVVLGMEQRFCQQCSRFHGVGEFDEAKRSCRRRLAGHNERRRKSSGHHPHSFPRHPPTPPENKLIAGRLFPKLSPPAGRAFSLLSSSSSSKNESRCNISSSPDDLPSRCSAALSELIAENRAAILGRDWHSNLNHHNTIVEDFMNNSNIGHQNNSHANFFSNHLHHQALYNNQVWDRFNDTGATMTLNFMHPPTSSEFEYLSVRGKSKEAQDCSDFWSSWGGTHVV